VAKSAKRLGRGEDPETYESQRNREGDELNRKKGSDEEEDGEAEDEKDKNNLHDRPDDILIVHGDLAAIQKAQKKDGFHIVFALIFTDHDFQTDEVTLARAIVRPDARIYGLTPGQTHFRQRIGADILALRRQNRTFQHQLNTLSFKEGDMLLLYGRREALENLRYNPNLLLLDELDEDVPQHNPKAYVSLAIMIGVIVSVTAGLLEIVTAAPLGAFGMVATRCLTLSELYDSVKWSVVLLVGGTLALGKAMQTTGAADLITSYLVQGVTPYGPHALLGVVYLVTSFLTNTIGNSAAAILMAPIALSSAATLGIAPKPLLLAVLFAAATSFNNPACYPTNSMVFVRNEVTR